MARRIAVTSFWVGVGLFILAARLFDLQVLQHHRLTAAALRERLGEVVLPAQRGEITDRNGQVLAVSEPAVNVTADPHLVTDAATEAAALSNILGVPAAQLQAKLQGTGQYAVLATNLSVGQGQAVSQLQGKGQLPGVYTANTTVRRYPDGFFMGHILGFLNAAGGAAGMELSYNRQLAGTNGYVLAQLDPGRQVISGTVLANVPAKQGLTLRLTIDAPLQEQLQQQLELAVATTKASRAFGIVLQPSTGAILAASAWPTYDPNSFVSGANAWDNTVQSFDMPPGSVFKPITASAALQSGIVTPTTPFYDPGVLNVGGVAIHNFQHLETHTTFQRAFEESANVVFGTVGIHLGVPTFYHYLQAFGLLGLPGGDLPGQQGNIVVPQAVANNLAVAEESFGETLSVTPLSLITALNVVADGGLLIQPHVGLALVSPQTGKVVQQIQPVVVRRVISASVAATVRQMMVGVVNAGTGQRAFIPCYDVGGKTGTSNIYGKNGVLNEFIASFVALAPASHPAAIVLIQLYNPQGYFNEGGEVAAPVAQTILSDALHDLDVPPSCTPGNITPPAPGSPGSTSLLLHVVTMPAITGLPVPQAVARTRAVGLYLQVTGTGKTVLLQDPSAGATVQEYTTAAAYTTAADQPTPGDFVKVPNVVGQTILQAAATLSQAGFAMEVTGVGQATVQDPPAGTAVAPGGSVQVTFGTGGAAAGP